MVEIKRKVNILFVFLCMCLSIFAQTKKPTTTETKKWINEQLSIYARGFTLTIQETSPGFILGNKINEYDINKVSYN